MRHDDPGAGGEHRDRADALVLIEHLVAPRAASAALLASLPAGDRGRMRLALGNAADEGASTWPPEVAALVEGALLRRAAALLAAFEGPPRPRYRFGLDAAFSCLPTCTGADGEPRVLHLGHVGHLDTDSRGNTVVVSASGRDAALVRDPVPGVAAALKAYRDGPGAGRWRASAAGAPGQHS
jgi:hypothetical protein